MVQLQVVRAVRCGTKGKIQSVAGFDDPARDVEGGSRMKIIITILAAMAVIDAVIAYACCVVAGRADTTGGRMRRVRK